VGSRSISRPSDRSTEPASGLGPFGSRSLRPEPSAVTQASTHEQSGLEPSFACMLRCGSRINLYPVERQWLVPKSCILVAARLQDEWDSSLVRLIRPTRILEIFGLCFHGEIGLTVHVHLLCQRIRSAYWSTPACCIGSVVNRTRKQFRPITASIPDADTAPREQSVLLSPVAALANGLCGSAFGFNPSRKKDLGTCPSARRERYQRGRGSLAPLAAPTSRPRRSPQIPLAA
jgi:hypothetical protein